MKNQTKTRAFVTEHPTLHCAGFEWTIYGDENRNAVVTVTYRERGVELEKWITLVTDWG